MHYHKKKNHLVIEIDERIQGMTLLEFFHYLHLSKKTIHLLRQNKDYTLNNTYVDYQTILKDKDILSIKAYEQGRDFIEEESSLDIIYEDDLLCIVNKPSNLIKVKKILFVIMSVITTNKLIKIYQFVISIV